MQQGKKHKTLNPTEEKREWHWLTSLNEKSKQIIVLLKTKVRQCQKK